MLTATEHPFLRTSAGPNPVTHAAVPLNGSTPNPFPYDYRHRVHSFFAGVDALAPFINANLTSGRGASVPLTNGKGAFSDSLAEWAMTAILHFNKQVCRLPPDDCALFGNPVAFFGLRVCLWHELSWGEGLRGAVEEEDLIVKQHHRCLWQIPRVIENKTRKAWEKFTMATVAGAFFRLVLVPHPHMPCRSRVCGILQQPSLM